MSDSRHFSIPLKGERVGFRGFTLIELVVVMALIAIMMALAIPNLQHILTDDTRKASQWILVQVPRLKSRAVSEGKIYTLHADMDGNMLWISNDGMSDEELSQAKKRDLRFPIPSFCWMSPMPMAILSIRERLQFVSTRKDIRTW